MTFYSKKLLGISVGHIVIYFINLAVTPRPETNAATAESKRASSVLNNGKISRNEVEQLATNFMRLSHESP